MSAECQECGSDLLGTQWDEGGMRCPVCDLRAENERLRGLHQDIAFAVEHGVDPASAKYPDPHFYTKDELIEAVGAFARAALEGKEE